MVAWPSSSWLLQSSSSGEDANSDKIDMLPLLFSTMNHTKLNHSLSFNITTSTVAWYQCLKQAWVGRQTDLFSLSLNHPRTQIRLRPHFQLGQLHLRCHGNKGKPWVYSIGVFPCKANQLFRLSQAHLHLERKISEQKLNNSRERWNPFDT